MHFLRSSWAILTEIALIKPIQTLSKEYGYRLLKKQVTEDKSHIQKEVSDNFIWRE